MRLKIKSMTAIAKTLNNRGYIKPYEVYYSPSMVSLAGREFDFRARNHLPKGKINTSLRLHAENWAFVPEWLEIGDKEYPKVLEMLCKALEEAADE